MEQGKVKYQVVILKLQVEKSTTLRINYTHCKLMMKLFTLDNFRS